MENNLNWIDANVSAPDLWKKVLVYENGRQYVARLEEWWWYEHSVYVSYPTHWMPLPNNPK